MLITQAFLINQQTLNTKKMSTDLSTSLVEIKQKATALTSTSHVGNIVIALKTVVIETGNDAAITKTNVQHLKSILKNVEEVRKAETSQYDKLKKQAMDLETRLTAPLKEAIDLGTSKLFTYNEQQAKKSAELTKTLVQTQEVKHAFYLKFSEAFLGFDNAMNKCIQTRVTNDLWQINADYFNNGGIIDRLSINYADQKLTIDAMTTIMKQMGQAVQRYRHNKYDFAECVKITSKLRLDFMNNIQLLVQDVGEVEAKTQKSVAQELTKINKSTYKHIEFDVVNLEIVPVEFLEYAVNKVKVREFVKANQEAIANQTMGIPGLSFTVTNKIRG